MTTTSEPSGFVYAKVHVLMADHPKVAARSDLAFRVHVRGILYCANLLTDGVVPKALAHGWGKRGVRELVQSEMWADAGTHYLITDYLQWNPSKVQVKAKKAAKAAGGLARAQQMQSTSSSKSPPNAQQMLSTTALALTPALEQATPKSLAVSPLANGKGNPERVALKNAIVKACEWSLTDMTKSLWGRVDIAAKELHDIDADPEDIDREAYAWRHAHPDIPVTPQVLATHFAEWAAGNLRPKKAGRR